MAGSGFIQLISGNDLLISHLKMSFDCKKLQYYYPSSLIVGVMDNPTDLSSFTPVDTVYTPDVNYWDWHHREVFFENYTGTGHYIALKCQYSSPNYFKVDNLTIDTAFTCHTPTNLMATGISPSSMYVTWEGEAGENEWQVAIVPDYSTLPDSSSVVTVHEKHHLFTNLTDSNYVFFVRTHCSNGWGYSDWVSIPVTSFAYQPATVPYSHNFEAGSENAAWRMETGNPVSRWQIGIPNGYSDSLLFITNNGADATYGSTIAEASDSTIEIDWALGTVPERRWRPKRQCWTCQKSRIGSRRLSSSEIQPSPMWASSGVIMSSIIQ